MSVHNTGRTFLVPLVEACLLPQGELGSSGKARVGPPSVSPVCCCLCRLAPSCSLFFASLPRLAIIAGRPFWSHASGWAMKYTVLAQETPPQPTPPILPRSGYRHEGWQGRRTLTSEHTEEKAKLRYCTSPADKKPDGTELKGRWPWSN